jgi:Ca2+-binding EF-hand superfamily protein
MNEFRLGFSEADVETLYKYFDVDGNGRLSYDEFLRGVRGEMN